MGFEESPDPSSWRGINSCKHIKKLLQLVLPASGKDNYITFGA